MKTAIIPCNLKTCAIARLPREFTAAQISELAPSYSSVPRALLDKLLDEGVIEVTGAIKSKGKREQTLYRKTDKWVDPDPAACQVKFDEAETAAEVRARRASREMPDPTHFTYKTKQETEANAALKLLAALIKRPHQWSARA